ncbi:threonylcarbamoyl-AMP synthase [Pseudoprevotella muciniphila]|uniref:L-threonylcarbamoyladenylate synthase n=1 Tax=Pseudoprevotella muciniphila TaxID=2133944 RepID=A0A5P8E4P4_9BACT|nr:L-threonylcarbamoyladenylate synthase [Pseudoprevotella muciniphila]QFQ11932.1 threonylcarbamoyl-AMP synthase [Pseudoprevotella muciniphila]
MSRSIYSDKEKALLASYREDISKAVEVMNAGGVILYPTDTIWGIGCDAANAEAVKRVFEIKRRSDAKSLICLIDSDAKLQFYLNQVPEVAWELLDVADKPLTIIFDGARNLAPNVVAEDGSVALRITRELFSKQLCFRMKRAIVSTSANISGMPAPQCFSEISDDILSAVDYVCASRRNEKRRCQPSGIIKLGSGGEVKIIR